MRLEVAAAHMVAGGVKLLTLQAANQALLPPAECGAHIGLLLPNGMERQYSLLDCDTAPRQYRVAVKREAAGKGGSQYIHDCLSPGVTLDLVAPSNNFPLVETAPHTVLIAGGIGITPIWCMAKRLRSLSRPFELHFACRARDEAAFLEEISGWAESRLHFDAECAGQPPDIAAIVAATHRDAHLYCCGPAPMLAAFESAVSGWPASQVHVEYFTPRFTPNSQGGYVVALERSGREVTVLPGKTILESVRELGIDVCSSCEQGICGSCETRVLAGVPDHRDSILSGEERALNRTIFICCSGSLSPRLVLDL